MAVPPEVEYLLSLKAVRDRSQKIFAAAKEDRLLNFHYHADKLPDAAELVISVITRDFGPDKFDTIPPHGRWQHFDVGGIDRVSKLLVAWEAEGCDAVERTRRLIDLFFVSVLLDAGAGDVWKFSEPGTANAYGRSEGIAVASLYMFQAGCFSSESGSVDGHGLVALDEAAFRKHFQISADNDMTGVGPRISLLRRVGASLLKTTDLGPTGRPGNLVDYMMRTSVDAKLDYTALWSLLQRVLIPSWPADRTKLDGFPLGDAWPLKTLGMLAGDGSFESSIQPFHKLTQWLAYSLTVPFVRLLNYSWVNQELGTGLPEYRNGGLFVDMGVLSLKDAVLVQGRQNSGGTLPGFGATDDVIVEWRALTVALLDELYRIISAKFASQGVELSMAQMLEAGTWKCGRELAAKHRPDTKSSPILIDSDGTIF